MTVPFGCDLQNVEQLTVSNHGIADIQTQA